MKNENKPWNLWRAGVAPPREKGFPHPYRRHAYERWYFSLSLRKENLFVPAVEKRHNSSPRRKLQPTLDEKREACVTNARASSSYSRDTVFCSSRAKSNSDLLATQSNEGRQKDAIVIDRTAKVIWPWLASFFSFSPVTDSKASTQRCESWKKEKTMAEGEKENSEVCQTGSNWNSVFFLNF